MPPPANAIVKARTVSGAGCIRKPSSHYKGGLSTVANIQEDRQMGKQYWLGIDVAKKTFVAA
ncbi:unnamed protein product, partial [marine sediment metagenome]